MAEPRPWWKRAFVWEIPFLAAVGAFMFWVRMLPYKAVLGGGRAYYIGTDPFYHYRETLGIVRAFPRVPRWDPWTFYPYGTGTGQFGSLFDWLAAAYVVTTQGRGASEAYIQTVLGVFPAVLGALLIVPFYYLAKRLLGTPGAVVGSLTLMVLPGEFLVRALAGYADHHVAEAFFALVAILGVYVAAVKGHDARAAVREWRDVRGYRNALVFGVLGGIGLAANIYAWPPAILFLVILTLWLTVVILLEDGRGGDGTGYAFGGSVAFVVSSLLVAPAVETTFLGEFNTYGILHVVLGLAAAAWLWVVHLTSRWTRSRGWSPWVVPGLIVGLALLAFLVVQTLLAASYASFLWGLSWVTGIGIRRTTLTIAEARRSKFFCDADTREFSCLGSDFGIVAPLSILILIGLAVWVLVKRRREDILLLVWSLVMVRATQTQIRFSYYLALNMALLVGWLAARIAEATRLTVVDAPAAPAAPAKGRKTRKAVAATRGSRPLQIAAVALVLLLVLPGNVFQSGRSFPGWRIAQSVGADGDLLLWMDGLDWMRHNTPDAGVDLSLIVERPEDGLYDYPPETYGVLSWWDYGHWIQTVALRPPVANPFQQAAPFASLYFTERDPTQAERMLDEWARGEGPVRYVWIDDGMATGKYGAITVWANAQDASRPRWGDGEYLTPRSYSTPQGERTFQTTGPAWHESMMSRLYDRDADGLGTYRLVYEHGDYFAVASGAWSDGSIACLHDALGAGCPFTASAQDVTQYVEGTAVQTGEGYLFDMRPVSRLKLFERVEGARVVGTAAPGEEVLVRSVVSVVQNGQEVRQFAHTSYARAGADGAFEVRVPYANAEPLGPERGGTNTITRVLGIEAEYAGRRESLTIPERAVLQGETIRVP